MMLGQKNTGPEHIQKSMHFSFYFVAQLPDDSSNLAEMRCLAGRDGFLTGLWPSSQSPFLAVRGSWERYMKSLDAKYRSNLRNRMRRLEAHGAVSIETVEGGGRLNGAMEEALRLEAAGWKGRAGSAIASCEQTRLFYTTLARRAARRGWLRLQFLVAGESLGGHVPDRRALDE